MGKKINLAEAQRLKEQALSYDMLISALAYDPVTGVFTWTCRQGPRTLEGAAAGSIHKSTGYIVIGLAGLKGYRACRLAVFYMTQAWPIGDVDHVNGVKADDRWANLRAVSTQHNCQNQIRARSDSASGLLGAFWDKKRCQWYSKIDVGQGKKHWLGTFPTALEAHESYVAAKRNLHKGCTI